VHQLAAVLPAVDLADSSAGQSGSSPWATRWAKLEERYGRYGAANILALSGVKCCWRGITEPQTLEDVRRFCGTLGDDDDSTVGSSAGRAPPPCPTHCLVINRIRARLFAWSPGPGSASAGARLAPPAPLLLHLCSARRAEVPWLIELPASRARPVRSGSARPAGTGG